MLTTSDSSWHALSDCVSRVYESRVRGDFSPVLAKHSKHLSLEDTLSIGVDRMQRDFEPRRQQVESWRARQLSAAIAKLTIYRTFGISWPIVASLAITRVLPPCRGLSFRAAPERFN